MAYLGNDVKKQIIDDRGYVIGQGDILNQDAKDRGAASSGLRERYRQQADEVYDPLIYGRGGYDPNDTEAITREGETRSSMALPHELDALQWTPEEIASIQGNPELYFDPAAMNAAQEASAVRQRAASQRLRGDLYGAIDENALTADTAGIELTPEEEQRIVTAAGQSAGVGYRAGIGDLEQKARAAGVDPLGVQAARVRAERAAAIEGANAMTRARVAASRERADRKTMAEDLRLGANRDISGRRTNAATVAGQADLNTEGTINTQQRQQQQFSTTTGTGIENTRATRAATVAGNRQATGRENLNTRFGQGQTVANTLSERARTIGDAKLEGAREGRGYLTGQNAQANQNTQAEADRQTQLYGQQMSGRSGTTQSQLQRDSQPGLWQKVAGTVIGAANAAGNMATGFSGGKADGGIVTEPTVALIGEEGPEAVVPLNDREDPVVRSGQLYGQIQQVRKARPRPPMLYGQTAA